MPTHTTKPAPGLLSEGPRLRGELLGRREARADRGFTWPCSRRPGAWRSRLQVQLAFPVLKSLAVEVMPSGRRLSLAVKLGGPVTAGALGNGVPKFLRLRILLVSSMPARQGTKFL